MSKRRRTGLWVTGILGLAMVAALGIGLASRGPHGKARRANVAIDEKSPLPVLAGSLRDSDPRALAVLYQKLAGKTGEPAPNALTDAEAAEWFDVLGGLRTGFLKFSGYGRSSALTVAARVLDRFAVEPAPPRWIEVLQPTHDLLMSGLADPDVSVRVTALNELGRTWTWAPGRALMPVEEQVLAEWRDSYQPPVVRRLADRERKSRGAAIACLGRLPIDKLAAPAIPYLEDPDPVVRQQVIVSFGGRPNLLTDDALLKRLYDPSEVVPVIAETILMSRGLNKEQISMGKLIFHPKPELRASVISLLKDRTDIDPEVWLLQLSRDSEESVRAGALAALAGHRSPEVDRRIAEMAAADASPTIRKAASQVFLPGAEKTASMPLLPGSPGLYPKAN